MSTQSTHARTRIRKIFSMIAVTAMLASILPGGVLGVQAPAAQAAPPADQEWVGAVGADGYVLAGWNVTSDKTDFPWATVSTTSASRHRWEEATSDGRALEDADSPSRNAAAYYSGSSFTVTLDDFNAAYTGDLRLYAVDWDSTVRRQTITVEVDDVEIAGSPVVLDTAFDAGVWIPFSISVPDGGKVDITVTDTGPTNAVLSGIFLGGATATPPPPAVLTIDDVAVVEGDSGTTAANLTVTRSHVLKNNPTITYSTVNTTSATGGGVDYVDVVAAPVVFADGVATAIITVDVVGDTIVETPDETFDVTLGGADGTFAGPDATVTITDDDTL